MTRRLLSLLTACLLLAPLLAPPAMAQDGQLQAFAGRTAPLAQDADLFSRAHRAGLTFGVGGGVALSDRVSVEAAATYQRFELRSPSAILDPYVGGAPVNARYRSSSPYNMFVLETNVQYTFRPSARVQPYVMGGLANKLELVEDLIVEADNVGIDASNRDQTSYSLAVQAGAGVQANVTGPIGLFAETLLQVDADARHAYPVRFGLTVGL